MSLQFDVEEFIRPLVSALYESSDEDMEIDTVSTTVVNQSLDDDSDIEVLALRGQSGKNVNYNDFVVVIFEFLN